MYSREEMEATTADLYDVGYIKPAAMIRQLLAENAERDALQLARDRATELWAGVSAERDDARNNAFLRGQEKNAALGKIAALQARVAELEAGLRFYADPGLYRSHPHGLAFDDRDKSYHARALLSKGSPDANA